MNNKCPHYKGKYNTHFYGIRCLNSPNHKTIEVDSNYLPEYVFKSDVRYTKHYRDKYIEDRCLYDYESCQIYRN